MDYISLIRTSKVIMDDHSFDSHISLNLGVFQLGLLVQIEYTSLASPGKEERVLGSMSDFRKLPSKVFPAVPLSSASSLIMSSEVSSKSWTL